MSATIAFDTHAYVKKLRDAGVDERQAEIQSEALVALVEDRLATKQDMYMLKRDLTDVESNLRRDMAIIEANLKRDLADVESNLKRDIKELDGKVEAMKIEILAKVDTKIEASKGDTIKWTAGMFVAQTAIIIGALFAVMKMNQPTLQPLGYPTPPVQEMRWPAPSASAPSTPAPSTPTH